MEQRIGIIGGSYNPVHIAHLIIADRFTEQMELDATYFVPTFRSPFKIDDEAADTVTALQRLEMLRLAIAEHPKFRAEAFEIERETVSYTIDTLRYFHKKFPAAKLFLLIGTDQAAAFTKWKDWRKVLALSHLCIARRPHTISPEMERLLTFNLSHENRSPEWISAPIMSVSSTEIRRRLAEGKSIRFLVPNAVERYISENSLYKSSV